MKITGRQSFFTLGAAIAAAPGLEVFPKHFRLRPGERIHYTVCESREGHQPRCPDAAFAVENPKIVRLISPAGALEAVNPDPKRKRLFVIDGSKALRPATNAVFGADNPVQRCRQHKLRNVMERLPEDQKDQVKSLMEAAWRLGHKEGMAKFASCQSGWSKSAQPRLRVCWKVWRNALPPTVWIRRPAFIGARPRQT